MLDRHSEYITLLVGFEFVSLLEQSAIYSEVLSLPVEFVLEYLFHVCHEKSEE